MKSFTVQLGGKEFLIQQDDDGKFILPDELKAWRSHKTAALKPSWEPVLCFRAPDRGMTYAELAIQHGSGALNVDAGRIGLPSETFPHRREAKIFGTGSGAVMDVPSKNVPGTMYGDAGGPSRFFYCAKASRSEREEGLDGFDKFAMHKLEDASISTQSNRRCKKCGHVKFSGDPCSCPEPEWEETTGSRVRNDHPTVKPIDMNKWLASLLLPAESVKPRRLLVPFSGSGSEIIGGLLAGWDDVTGIEQDKHYAEIAQARIAYWGRMPVRVVNKETGVETVKTPVQGGLF